jgi:hypothetical protein
MGEKTFSNELQRAQARTDASELVRDLDDYYRFHREIMGEGRFQGVTGGNHCRVMDAHWDDPDRGLAYLALAMSRFDDTSFLGVLAAGLLEDLLRDPTPEILNRIMAEARKTARFRWMLSGVWLHVIAERARTAVGGAIGNSSIEQPLPPAPW